MNPVNDAPVTSNISQTQDENNSEASDLSSFTTDVDGNSLTYTIVSDVTDGSTSLDGSVVTIHLMQILMVQILILTKLMTEQWIVIFQPLQLR